MCHITYHCHGDAAEGWYNWTVDIQLIQYTSTVATYTLNTKKILALQNMIYYLVSIELIE